MNTKKMLQSSMIAALFGSLSLINTYSGGLLDTLIGYFLSVPIIYYGYTYSLKENLITSLVSIIVVMITGLPNFIFISIYSIIFGLFIGECLKKQVKKDIMLIGSFIISFIFNYLLYQGISSLLNVNLNKELIEVYNMLSNYYKPIKNIPISIIEEIIPFVILIISLIESYIMLTISQLMLMKLKINFPENFHIATFKLNKKQGYILMIVFLLSYILNTYINNIFIKYLYYLCLLIFIIEGLSYLTYLTIIIGKPILSVVVFILTFIPIFSLIYGIIGVIDIFFNLRKEILI